MEVHLKEFNQSQTENPLSESRRMASLLQRVRGGAAILGSPKKVLAPLSAVQQRNLAVHEHVSMSLLQVGATAIMEILFTV